MRNPLRVLRSRLRKDEDFVDEIESHIAHEAERLVSEGWKASDAFYEARRLFGNVGAARERFHETRTMAVIDALRQDIRYSLRALLRAPVFTVIAVLSLALAIGANSAVFAFVNAVLFKPLPVPHPERLVAVQPDTLFTQLDYPTIAKFRQRDVFDGVAGVFLIDRANITIAGLPAGRAKVLLVTGDYFSMLGVRAAAGRTITMDDERTPGAHAVAVISDAYWQTRFARAPDIVGRTFMLNRTTYVVVGVAPPQFVGEQPGLPADVWIPVTMQAEVMPERPDMLLSSRRWLTMLARMKPGMTRAQSTGMATQVYQQILLEPMPDRETMSATQVTKESVELEPMGRGLTPGLRQRLEPMVVVWGIVGLVLAIACVNVAGLLLVRATLREREIATRLALGARVRGVARLLLTEGALIGISASALGVVFARSGARWLEHVAASGIFPVRLDLSDDWRVLVLTVGTSLAVTLVCALVPARRAARLARAPGLMIVRGSGLRGVRSNFGRALVVAQVALAVVLVVAAGLFTRTLSALESQDTGFDREHMLQVTTAAEEASLSGERLASLFDAVTERIGALPGVRSVAVFSRGLLAGNGRGAVNTHVPGYVPAPNELPYVPYNYVTPSLFRTAGLRLLAGRLFTPEEATGKVAIVSESMARHFFGTVNAAGKRFGIARDAGASIEIVGVVRDAKDASLRDQGILMMYLPYRQEVRRLNQMCILIRVTGDPAALAAVVRRTLTEVEPALPILSVESMRSQMRQTLTMEWFTALASSFFGGVALLLAAIGLFALVAQGVLSRTSEIGIRMALGATAGSVTRLILRESLLLVVGGLVVGNVIAVLAARAIEAQLFQVSAVDLATFAWGTGIILVAALAAGLVPTRRATRIDPAISLRHE